jgi:ATP-dependent helicase/nuclease subunit A
LEVNIVYYPKMQVLKEQQDATNTTKNIWLTANAGTGKTHVLSNRYMKLILEGCGAEKILCITYTNAAAEEMKERILKKINELLALSKKEFQVSVSNNYGLNTSEASFIKKRLLIIADNPSLLKIMTIHAFCQSVLKKFPLEADIPPFFEVLDELKKKEFLKQIKEELFLNNENVTSELNYIYSNFTELTIEEIFNDLFLNKIKIEKIINKYSGINNYKNLLKEKLEIINNADEIKRVFFDKHSTKIRSFFIRVLDANDGIHEKSLQSLEAIEATDFIGLYKIVTNDGKEYKTFITKKINEIDQSLKSEYSEIVRELDNTNNKIKNYYNYEATINFLIIFFEINKKYSEIKNKNYFLDFDDLIIKTYELLTKKEFSSWILYKLDGSVDHLLVDEAQDTNPLQWEIISALSEEFFQGQEENSNRTIFVVGDEKQSIYSFQGSDVKVFDRLKKYFSQASKALNDDLFEEVFLNTSFRSLPAVLNIVDLVANNKVVKPSITNLSAEIKHRNFRNNYFGYFEFSDLEEKKEKKKNNNEIISWKLPSNYSEDDETSSKRMTAKIIANKVYSLLNSNRVCAHTDALLKPSDILILVQKRDEFSKYVTEELNNSGISCAGVDRYILNKSLTAKDLISLAKFHLNYENSLNLACLLKSPFFNLSDEELINYKKDNLNLLNSIKNKNNKLFLKLKNIILFNNYSGSFEFFYHFLEILNYKNNFISNAGNSSLEFINNFLLQAKLFEKSQGKSLEKFINHILNNDIELNVDNSSSEQVRMMTVHGSKGLEAPVVIIADATSIPDIKKDKVKLNNDLILCAANKDFTGSVYNDLKDDSYKLALDEYYRLLYVALTRARDELYIFGYHGNNSEKKYNWFNVIKESVEEFCDRECNRLIYSDADYLNFINSKADSAENKKINYDSPYWLKERYTNIEPDEILSPSEFASGDNFDNNFSDRSADYSRNRGNIIHKLLEIFSSDNLKFKEEIYNNILDKNNLFSNDEKKEIKDEVESIINDKNLEFIFNSNGASEVPVFGEFEEKYYSGKIDRIIARDDNILIIDFKTNKNISGREELVAEKYRQQLRAYENIVKKLYENKNVTSAILFTNSRKIVYMN